MKKRSTIGSYFATISRTVKKLPADLLILWLSIFKKALCKKDKSIAIRSLTYYGINLFFVIGAIVGAVVTKYLDVKSIFIASALLIIPFIMMFKSSENVEYI